MILMVNEEMKRLEEHIRYYYEEMSKITRNERKLRDMEKSLEEAIENKKSFNSIHLDTELNIGLNLSYERVQTSKTGISPQEAQLIKQEEKLEAIVSSIVIDISEKKEEIRSQKLHIGDIGNGIKEAIDRYKDTDREKIIIMRYRDGKSLEEIGEALNMAKSTVDYTLKKPKTGILACISKWLQENMEDERKLS